MELSERDVDELVEFCTLLDEDRELLIGKRGATALGFALLLKHYSRHGRFPRGPSDLSDDVIAFVARQLSVDALDLGFYEWSGSTIEYHRAQIRAHLGYRVATVADQEKLTRWLAANVAPAERRPERVREELYPNAGPLLTRRLNTELVTATWDDLLRVAASVKCGHATAALVVGKLCSSKRQQNALTSAIKEYGALRRTVYAARYLADPTYRRRIARQLNKGENLHALRRELAYAGEGAVRRRRHHEQQSEQMWCLTVATNAIVTWTTEYYGLAVTALRHGGRPVDDDVLAHIWPSHHANVNFYGTHTVDIDGELAKLDADGYRPLRLTTDRPMTE